MVQNEDMGKHGVISWFPGHMTKAHRMIKEDIKLVDVVIELLDARAPLSSMNPLIKEAAAGKPRVIALNKSDLADTDATREWIDYFRTQGLEAVALEAANGHGTKNLVKLVEKVAAGKIRAMVAKGLKPRAVRAMVLGIPNVGKSSLINKLVGSAIAKTGDKPGVTRGKQWLKVGRNLELLDTPGVLWPKLDNQRWAFRLALTGAISDEVLDLEKIAIRLLVFLHEHYPERLINRYKLGPELPEAEEALLEQIGKKRGCLRAGGVVDFAKVYHIILTEFRAGKLGPFTLDAVTEAQS